MTSSRVVVFGLAGKRVLFTGKLFRGGEHIPRAEASRLAQSRGAHPGGSRSDVSRFTDLLVRGESPAWKEGDYGVDEENVARLQREGYGVQIIDADGFFSLIDGGWAYALEPHVPPNPLATHTAPFRPPSDQIELNPVTLTRDLAEATNAHHKFVVELAERAIDGGLMPVRSLLPDALFDLGWLEGGRLVIIEVKSLTAVNAVQQMRLGLGQVLDYHARFPTAVPVLAVNDTPPATGHWEMLCAAHGVTLVWPDVLERILPGTR